ncbi:MAG TPA: phage tail tube protein, partial [Candidatus Paceibacterota bacterium]
MANKIDSNVTGLRFAEEASLGVLPGTPVWYPLEPNSYKDFGGQLATMARRPIDPTRQMKKGTITDLDASGGFNQDLTQDNYTRLLQGILFADAREKITTAPMNGTAIVMGAVSGTPHTFAAPSGLGTFLVNGLVKSSGYGVAANNTLSKVTTVTATLLTMSAGLADETTPPAAAKLEQVGYEFASATLDVAIVGGLPRLTRMSGVVDFTTFGLIPGEWIYLGGDIAGNTFTNNVGWGRVNAVVATYIELDKTSWTPQAEVGTGKTIRIFFGTVIKNEASTALIKRRTYQIERQLGSDANGVMSEYLIGAVPNELALDVKQADKVVADLDFVAIDNEQRNGTTGIKSGTRPTLTSGEAFNTSSDFSRIKLATVSASDPAPTPLFAFATDFKLSIKNN